MSEPILQACVVPYRWNGDELEVCLITSLKKKRWIFPKGIIDPGDNCAETSVKEALEEAGLHGRIVGKPLGVYEDFKWGSPLKVTAVMMEVTQCDDDWLEADVRERTWVTPELAMELLSRPVLRDFVEAAVDRTMGSR